MSLKNPKKGGFFVKFQRKNAIKSEFFEKSPLTGLPPFGKNCKDLLPLENFVGLKITKITCSL